jgi:hypothetical protein
MSIEPQPPMSCATCLFVGELHKIEDKWINSMEFANWASSETYRAATFVLVAAVTLHVLLPPSIAVNWLPSFDALLQRLTGAPSRPGPIAVELIVSGSLLCFSCWPRSFLRQVQRKVSRIQATRIVVDRLNRATPCMIVNIGPGNPITGRSKTTS